MKKIELEEDSQLDSASLLKSLTFCVIDLETTGGNQSYDKIIEIGLVKISNLEINGEMSSLIKPEIPIPDFIQKLTGIKEKDIVNSPTIENKIDRIIEFMSDHILIAHNISFDIPFLNSVLKRLGRKELTNKVICTNVMTKYLIPEIMNSNLNYLCQLFEIKHHKAHRAKDDAKATAEILLRYLQIYIEKNIRKVNQLYYPKNKFELDRINLGRESSNEQIIEIIKNAPSPLTVTIKGEKGVMVGVIPLIKCSKEFEIVETILKLHAWELVTIRLMGPLLEGILQLNLHISKFPEDSKNLILAHITENYAQETADVDRNFLGKLDYMVTPHLIKEQLICYSFLNFSLGTKLIFKYPTHKKKLLQHLATQKKRFKTFQKEKKKLNMNKELIPILNNHLFHEFNNKKTNYFFITQDQLKKNEEELVKSLEDFCKKKNNVYLYPKKHL